LSTTLKLIKSSDLPLFTLGLSSINSFENSNTAPLLPSPLLLKLLNLISDCIELDNYISDINNQLIKDSFEKSLLVSDKFINISVDFLQETYLFQHSIKMFAIDNFITGFMIYKPISQDRFALFRKLLIDSPQHNDENIRNIKFSLWEIKNSNILNLEAKNGILSRDYYLLYLLQKMCILNSSNNYFIPNAVNHQESKLRIPQSVNSTSLLRSLSTSIVDSKSMIIPPDFPLQRAMSHTGADDVIVESIFDRNSLENQANVELNEIKVDISNAINNEESIEKILIERLSISDLMFNELSTNKISKYGDLNSSFWGELELLKSIQQYYIKLYTEHSEELTNGLIFNTNRCSNDILLSGGDKIATFNSTKSWSTCSCVKISDGTMDDFVIGMDPNSGIHEWSFRIDKCDKGNIFVGVITEEATMDSYIGCDKFGWGLIGTKSYWHNKMKVKSDIGHSFSTGSVVNLRLDTIKGIFSIYNGKEWITIVSNLPKVILYPAISMHHKEDRITLISTIPNMLKSENTLQEEEKLKNPKSKTSNIDLIKRSLLTQTSCFSFIKLLCSNANKILQSIENINDSDKYKDKFNIILSHPLIGLFIPSLISTIILNPKNDFVGFTASQLIPYFTILTKRMSCVYETLLKLNSSSTFNPLVGNIQGKWVFKSSCNSASIPAQEYSLFLEVYESIDNKDKIIILGHGDGDLSEVKVEGTQYGTRLKFLETWNKGGTCIIEGRLSLCGCFFEGIYKDTLSNKSGVIEGFRENDFNRSNTIDIKTNLLNSSILCSKVCGILSAHLVVGLVSSVNYDLLSDFSFVNSVTTEAEANSDLFSKTNNEYVDQENDSTLDQSKKNDYISKLSSSNLFSGGLPLNDELLSYFHDQIQFFINPLASFTSSNIEDNAFHNWWFSFVFPILQSKPSSNVQFLSEFLLSLSLNQDSGKQLDEYVCNFIGQTNRVGGDSMKITRRLVLISLIKHCGIEDLCLVELSQIVTEKKLMTDRPHALVIEVWRCAQKVIENAVRMKQKTGLSYEIICENLNNKANVLINIECNGTCNSIISQLEIYCDECYSDIKDKHNIGQTNAVNFKEDSSIQLYCSKLLKETSNFLNEDISNNDLILLISLIKKSTFQAICRTAGLRSYMLLFQKTNDDVTSSIGKFQSLQTIQLQYTAIEYVSLSLHGHTDIGSFSFNFYQNNSSNTNTTGHYADGIKAVNATVMTNLKSSFECLYEFIASLLTRCTWGNNREGQCVSLSAWGILIRPSDHIFLNRVGIFRILQTVLDDTRTSMSKKDHSNDIITSPNKNNSISDNYWDEMVTTTITRLSTLVLRVVHSLASQVTFSKEDNNLNLSTNKLQKMASGPDTLSQSLFDMLYAELFISMKDMISLTNKYHINETSSSQNIEVNNNDILLGEQYIYKILRLLYFVSNSPICQKSLSTPKWYSLLISSIGCGGLGIQRRIMRLLRRLLVNINPVEFKAFVPISIFNNRDEIILSVNPLDEDDIDIIIEDQMNSIETNDSMIFSSSSSSAERLIYLFLEAVSVLIPPLSNSNLFDKKELVTLLHKSQTITESLSAEAILVLRVLQGVPLWRTIINSLFYKLIMCEKYANKWENENYLRMISSSLSVCGGYIDRLRIGGIACLRPFCLLNSSDAFHFGNRLAGTTRSCGMIVGLSDSSVEVILMEKGIRQVKSIHNIPNSDIKTIQHTTSVATSLPIIAVKINRSDVISSSDVPVIADFISNEVFSQTLLLLSQYGIPWLTEACAVSKEKNKELQVERPNLPSQAKSSPNLHSNSRSNFDFNFKNQGQINNQQDDDEEEEEDEDIEEDDDEEDDDEEDDDEEDIDEEDNDEKDNDEEDNENSYEERIYNQSSNLKQSSNNDISKPENFDNREEISDNNALQIFAVTNMFRSMATLLQSEPLTTCFVSSSVKFKDLLDLANEESSCGGLSVIEGIEERWSDLWDKYNILMSNPEVTVDNDNSSQNNLTSSNSNLNNNSSLRSQFELTRQVSPPIGLSSQQLRDSNQSQLNGIPLMEAAVSSGIFGESRVLDEATQQAAVAQMLEMGLPKDWCEVALRRCRYNVEMAINMCFEHDQGMVQIVAEDALMREAQQARGNDRPRGSLGKGRGNAGRSNGREISQRGFGIEEPQQKIDMDSLVNHLLEMGFPKSWCVQALQVSNNDVDAALIWILQHGEELKDDDEESTQLETEFEIINPLCTLSGTCQIFNDLKCVVNSDMHDFPSVGCRGFGASNGKWYYEITLIKSGCVQLGWADSSYQGCALEGQGVGDDAHSWSYDGYRSCLWHEISASWGAKWSSGDVIGCSIDIDNRHMSFTLNGYGEEVNMGLAFNDFEFKGHLYPCISLSRSECVQFNLGSTPFKHQPPSSEYQGFIKNVELISEENSKIKDEILSRDVNLNEFIFNFNKSKKENSNGNNNFIEDSLEYFANEDKYKNDRDLQWKRHRGNGDNLSSHKEINRYFNNEGNIHKHDKKMNYSPKFSSNKIPENKKSILFQFSDISKDVCILYSRLSVLRIINSFSNFSHEIKNKFILQLSDNEDKDSDDQSYSTNIDDKIQNKVRSLMKIVRTSCLTSNRTKSYLQILSLLPSSVSVPSNLGSIYSIGGFPLLDELNNSMKSIISYFRFSESNQIIESLLDQISVDTINSSRRDFSSSWQIWPNGITPFVIKENNLSDLDCITFPSLAMAMWLTPLLLEQFSKEISDISKCVDVDKKRILIQEWVERLVKYWCISLRSPNVLVKTCGMKMLSIIVQELSQYGSKHSKFFINMEESRIFNIYIPLERLKKITLRHLAFERGNLPICSEYLQTLLDLVISTSLAIENNSKTLKSNLHFESDINNVETIENFPSSHNESISDSEDPDFNWENIHGRLFSDDGWQTWTGSVHQLQVVNDKGNNLFPTQIDSMEERRNKEDIPELLPGCRVFRMISVPKTTIIQPPVIPPTPLSNDMWDEEHSDNHANDSDDSDAPTNITYIAPNNNSPVPIIRISSTDSITPSPSSPLIQEYSSPLTPFISNGLEVEKQSIEQFGTVVGLTSWGEGGLSIGMGVPGTARIIKWDDIEEQEVVAWGTGDKLDRFDVTHVKLDKDNKIITKYANPNSKLVQLGQSYFGSDATFGIILRVRQISRKDCDDSDVANRLIGVMEWPDFNSVVYITGYIRNDGSWSFTEKKLVTGPKHASWGIRFGQNHWRAGTTYDISPTQNNKLEDCTDRFGGSMIGQFQYLVNILKGKECSVVGDITFQQDVLFKFDNLMKSPGINVSIEKTSITKGGPLDNNSPGLVYGNVGFSSGVHFWEIKIDQSEPGSIYLGVAEKDITRSQCPSRWIGCGFVNHRTALQGTISPNSERERDRLSIYGDQFNTGDTVGVMLDMNRGRLSFFLDGLKYGEHIIEDLGEAFDSLATPFNIRPRTLFPIVGLNSSKNIVVLTPRWLSSIGINQDDELNIISKAWELMSSWDIDRPISEKNQPKGSNLWAYKYAWNDWRRWKLKKYVRVRTRCKASSMLVAVDTSPYACVEASIRLGLSNALFKGDRVLFSKSAGRSLDTKEEAVILGGYRGKLWYRLDTLQGDDGNTIESSNLAWSLVPHDIEGMTLIRRGNAYNKSLSQEILDIPLPRIPLYHGGMISITHSGGAVVRDGIEIDTSDNIFNIPQNSVLYAVEKRVNSSNITRYRIVYEDISGWISERMRGINESLMLSKLNNSTKEEISIARAKMVKNASKLNLNCRLEWVDVSNMKEALNYYAREVDRIGCGSLLQSGEFLDQFSSINNIENEVDYSLTNYISLSTTIDGTKQWSIEADMQLSELISKCSIKEGVIPINLSYLSLKRFIESISDNNSMLINIDIDRTLARASILRVTNQLIGYALPYLNIGLPEEKRRYDTFGTDNEIQIVSKLIKPNNGNSFSISSNQNENKYDEIVWAPPCCGRNIRSVRRVLFVQTKKIFWESVLVATTTSTPLHPDEYEDPREIKSIKINRVKATQSRLAAILNPSNRIQNSVFGQLHKELRSWNNSQFRRSYLGKGHGGQKRSFKVKFLGEGVNDYGGPYRAVFEQIVDELQCDSISASTISSERCLLPLLIPSSNRSTEVGLNQDKFALSTAPSTPIIQEFMHFCGKLMGTAVRQNLNMCLDLSPLLWNPLVKLPVSFAHIEAVDTHSFSNLNSIIKLGVQLEEEFIANSKEIDINYQPSDWLEIDWTIYLPDGSRVPLILGGEERNLTLGNWREYVHLVENYRLREGTMMLKMLRDGLSCVVPIELLPIFTPNELETLISGQKNVDISLLRQCTEYEDILPDSKTVIMFWELLEEFSDEERTLFLRFVWARSRLPTSSQESTMNFKLQGSQGPAKKFPDKYLPHAQTCFFSFSLPEYSTKEIMREKILYAIHNSPNMDADVRLHSSEGAEGWT
jgi:hypothetical protein